MQVEAVKFNPRWIEIFSTEKILLKEHLGDLVENIHHIGSTAVPGLSAKPVIDIIIEVFSLDKLDELSPVMESLGYEAKGEFGISGRRYYRKRGIGSALVEAIEKKALELGLNHLFLYTPESEYFYTKLGWQVLERETYHNVSVTIMEKEMSGYNI